MKNIKFLSGAILAVLFIISITQTAKSQEQKKEETITIKTSAVCSMCKERIESAMAFEKGVKAVNLDVKTKILTVTYKTSKTDPDKLKLAVTKIGYDADDLAADPTAYEKLPACCKKGNETH
jgi:periplasmic mercuric ion binding protein